MALFRSKILFVLLLTLFSLNSFAKMTMYFIDVGQGDSEFIELPNGKTLLIDGGPSKTSIASFLKEKNIKKIDYMILSHPHSDHYSGLAWVAENLQIEHFYDSQFIGSNSAEALREKIKNKAGVTVHYPEAGEELDLDSEVKAKIFNNCVGAVIAERNANNCSLVIKLTHHEQSVLFMGDAEKAVLTNMIKNWENELQSDLIKIAHHGSATGTTLDFLNAIQPKEAFIEVGKENNYGHPTTKVLDLLQNLGTKIFRTDIDGTQSVTFE